MGRTVRPINACVYCKKGGGFRRILKFVDFTHYCPRQLHLTYLLTPWCRVLLEKLTGLKLLKKSPSFLWNPKVHYRTHKRPPPVPTLGQPNPVHIPTSHLLEIHPNIIHPSTPRSPQWCLSLRLPHQDPIRPPLLTHTRHMPSPSHSSRFYHPHNIASLKVSNKICPFYCVPQHYSCLGCREVCRLSVRQCCRAWGRHVFIMRCWL